MGDTFTHVVNGHAAPKMNCQELGLINEKILLNCINTQNWIREKEASLLTGMSEYTVGQVSRRLAERGQIFREKLGGGAGFFMRLRAKGAARIDGKSGKDIDVPNSWKHDALALQTLHFLSKKFACEMESEMQIRHMQNELSKIPDGRLISNEFEVHIEQEFSKKSGVPLRYQSACVADWASRGIFTFIAYPYGDFVDGSVNHEIRQANSIREIWGDSSAPHIKFLRCHFDSLLDFHHLNVARFEIIDLPKIQSTQSSANRHSKFGFMWTTTEEQGMEGERMLQVSLKYCGETKFVGTFSEAVDDAENYGRHFFDVEGDVIDYEYGYNISFCDFVDNHKNIIEKKIAESMDICMSQ